VWERGFRVQGRRATPNRMVGNLSPSKDQRPRLTSTGSSLTFADDVRSARRLIWRHLPMLLRRGARALLHRIWSVRELIPKVAVVFGLMRSRGHVFHFSALAEVEHALA
jgi:hypothetical protein